MAPEPYTTMPTGTLNQAKKLDLLAPMEPVKLLSLKVYKFEYPVLEYPEKIKSISFDKLPEIEGTLQGIKGQYLILDTGVLNIRKHNGYKVSLNL